jgi:hypothetical protein
MPINMLICFFVLFFLLQYPVYFAFEDDDIDAVLADVKRNDAIGQPATATTGGYNCYLLLNISQTLNSVATHVFQTCFMDPFLSEKYLPLICSISPWEVYGKTYI